MQGRGFRLGVSCGVDIIEIDRVQRAIETEGEKFLKKIFTPKEIEYCESRGKNKYHSYAVRFAAKEAVSKAFGTGIRGGMKLSEIEIENDYFGKPRIILSGRAAEIAEQKRMTGSSISLSHCESYAAAFVVIEVG